MDCPYYNLPASSWWDRSMGPQSAQEIGPHVATPLRIDRHTRVASAGSCFAQNISKSLVARGFNYFVTENAPDYMSTAQAAAYNYGIFSARYGNIYTPLQLLQLAKRALGTFQPSDQFRVDAGGRCFDLLRPRVMPKGFASTAEAVADLEQHLHAVRRMFENADVFLFTLGLTEGWISKLDGTVYPTCPGCGSAGDYDPDAYTFRNFSIADTSEHLSEVIALLQRVNPSIEIILTVSPVPLIATMEPRHVLQATTYSKSVLRVTAEEMVKKHCNVHYFASYEIITATRNTHRYFAEDGRTVSEEGVTDVMEIFFRYFSDHAPDVERTSVPLAPRPGVAAEQDIVCDEEAFYRALAGNRSQQQTQRG
jgi:hypothetical protein